MFNTEQVSQETKDTFSGIIWFLILVPIAMGMHFLAKYYNMIEYTVMGWFVATLGAIQLGFALARGGKRIFSLPIRSKKVVSN